MPDYVVEWRMDITADTPAEAARLARHYQTRPGTTVDVFDIIDQDGGSTRVDLTELDETNDDMQRAFAAGWEMRYAGDPTEDLASRVSGPVLYHPEHDRVWPPSDPEGAYRDLGLDDDDFCRTCKCLYDGHGDGYDGECPDCADKTEAERLEDEGQAEMEDKGWRRASPEEIALGFMKFQHEGGAQADAESWSDLMDEDPSTSID